LVLRRRGAALPDAAVRVEQDRAARVVLVVEQELSTTGAVSDVPSVRVRTEVEDVARVVRVEEVGLDEADRAVHLLLALRGGVAVHLDVRRDEGLVAADRVVAGAAGDQVVLPAAEDDVGAHAGVNGVVTGFSVDLVVPADVDEPAVAARLHGQDRAAVARGVRGSTTARTRAREAEQIRTEVRAADRVVEERDSADDDLLHAEVVLEAEELGGRADRGRDVPTAHADDAHNATVVADDRVG